MSGGLKKKGFLTALTTMIKKDPTISIRKQVKEVKVYKKTVLTIIKKGLSSDDNTRDYALWGVIEKNTTSHLNVLSLQTAVEEGRNKRIYFGGM